MTESTEVGRGKVALSNWAVEWILEKQMWECKSCHVDFEVDFPASEFSDFKSKKASLKKHYRNDADYMHDHWLINCENINPVRKPKNRVSRPSKDLNSNKNKHKNYILLCSRCNKISLKNDQINIRISNYQKKVLQDIAAEDNQSVADYIYNLLDNKMKEDEDTKSRWLNKDK